MTRRVERLYRLEHVARFRNWRQERRGRVRGDRLWGLVGPLDTSMPRTLRARNRWQRGEEDDQSRPEHEQRYVTVDAVRQEKDTQRKRSEDQRDANPFGTLRDAPVLLPLAHDAPEEAVIPKPRVSAPRAAGETKPCEQDEWGRRKQGKKDSQHAKRQCQ